MKLEPNKFIINSALIASEVERIQKETSSAETQLMQEKIAREERMVAGAEASVAQKKLLEEQVEIFQKQNELLLDNYTKLKEMFDAQVEANIEAKKELARSKRFNVAMMIISIVAMFAAMAGPIATLWVSK